MARGSAARRHRHGVILCEAKHHNSLSTVRRRYQIERHTSSDVPSCRGEEGARWLAESMVIWKRGHKGDACWLTTVVAWEGPPPPW